MHETHERVRKHHHFILVISGSDEQVTAKHCEANTKRPGRVHESDLRSGVSSSRGESIVEEQREKTETALTFHPLPLSIPIAMYFRSTGGGDIFRKTFTSVH